MKIQELRLTAAQNVNGQPRIMRSPKDVHMSKKDIDVVRIVNASDLAIPIRFLRVTPVGAPGADLPFEGPLPDDQTLAPGGSIDIPITKPGHLNFRTTPANLTGGGNDSDLHIGC